MPVSAAGSIDLSRPVAECRPYSAGLYPLVTPLYALLMGQTPWLLVELASSRKSNLTNHDGLFPRCNLNPSFPV